MKTVSTFLSTLLAVAFTATAASAQQAPYPNRPITWVLAAGPGSVTDNSARLVAKVLSDKIGQPVIVDNRPGAAGIIGAEVVAQAKPDGYTMLYANQGQIATFPFLYKKLSYDPMKAFVPVHGFGESSLLMVVNSSKPYTTVEEFIEYAKKNPGKINFGSSGTGTATHLLGEMFQTATGTSLVHIPYRLPSNLYTDLLSGTVDVIFDYSVVMRPHVDAGKLRALAISRADRLKTFPSVPTFKERGLDIELTAWASVAMPAGTPPEIVNKMSAAMAETMSDPAVVKYFEENDFGNLGHIGPAKLKEFYISESEKYKKVVEKSGVSLD